MQISRFAFRKNEKGIAAVEMAAIAPAFLIILMGGLELGHTLYIQSIMNGEIQKAARDASLETGGETATQEAIDAKVRGALLHLNNAATINIDRASYQNFTKAQARQPEDVNGNGICETGENWIDRNFNGLYDANGGSSGQGGAKDVVVYTVTMNYPRLFPVAKLIGFSSNANLTARTVLANQPFGDQATNSGTPQIRACT
jgi:hypothetical protein